MGSLAERRLLSQFVPHKPRNRLHISQRLQRLGRIAAMLAGILIALRRAGIRPAVHTAPLPPFHGWGLARRALAGHG